MRYSKEQQSGSHISQKEKPIQSKRQNFRECNCNSANIEMVSQDDFFPDPKPNTVPKQDQMRHDIENRMNESGEPFLHINDVSRMSSYPNGTPVSNIFFPRCEEDVLNIVQAAHSAGKRIGIRGTKHSMGYVLVLD